MRNTILGVAILLVFGSSAARLYSRWREERVDRRVTILVDWAELSDWAARQQMSDEELLGRLQKAGASGLLIGASTIQDYLAQDFIFSNRALAETVVRQLLNRGVVGVNLKKVSGKFRITGFPNNMEKLKDIELGFNPELLGKARQVGFNLVLRINNDPWLSKDQLFEDLSEITSANQGLGFLLNTDDPPGGSDALPQWVDFLKNQGFLQLLFEFRPSKSSLKVAFKQPQNTYRAHTIPSNELKDLTPYQERSRWLRAVQERSCRFLLFHLSPSDSLGSYLENIYAMRQDLMQKGWEIGWPRPRTSWSFPTFFERRVNPVLALLLAILIPLFALRVGLIKNPSTSFFLIVFLTLLGASVMAAVADNAHTRLQVVPFRGVKLALALSWLGSFFALFSWREIQGELFQNVRRVDLFLGLGCLVLVGYFLMRTGNAGAGWKAGWEQGLRDKLEDLFVARPRFKEFAIGYPLLILGLHMAREKLGRLLIALGMIGPISMVNTFCHLHSPLYLAFWRSFNGILVGALVGWSLLGIKKCLSS